MTIKDAHRLLDKEYYNACAKSYVSDPVLMATATVHRKCEEEHYGHKKRKPERSKKKEIEYDDFDRSDYEWR